PGPIDGVAFPNIDKILPPDAHGFDWRLVRARPDDPSKPAPFAAMILAFGKFERPWPMEDLRFHVWFYKSHTEAKTRKPNVLHYDENNYRHWYTRNLDDDLTPLSFLGGTIDEGLWELFRFARRAVHWATDWIFSPDQTPCDIGDCGFDPLGSGGAP